MIYIILTILCSTSIVIILKHSETKNGSPLILLAGNYIVAAVISLFFCFAESKSQYSFQSLGFGAVIGLLFMLSFFSYAKAIAAAGPALASVSARISVGIPVILAITIFNESPGTYQLAGFSLTVVTLIFFYFSLKKVNT
ncbi:MAG: EamA family transporter, partial [Ignavibacteriaceae bacterium]|nr:EamA family transporter [Ignavibacteriaceae bacterium]